MTSLAIIGAELSPNNRGSAPNGRFLVERG